MPLPYIIPRIMIEERQKFWKKDFWEIKKEFFKLFDPDIVIRKKIEKVNVIRNILSHSNVKLGQKFFLYSPKNGQKLTEAWTALNLTKVNDQFKPIVLKTDYSLEINYLHDFEIIQSLDQEYFSMEADKLGIIYSHIR